MKALVVGSGVAGLASAIRLAARGWQVEVFEKENYPGGKLSSFEASGFRFDRGPSLFTLPELVEDLFRTAGKEIAGKFSYSRLDETCRYFFDDGIRFTSHSNADRFSEDAEKVFNISGASVLSHLKRSEKMYQTLAPVFLDASLHRPSHLLKSATLKALSRLPSMGVFSNLDQYNQQHLQEPHLVQLFNRFATYNGSDPYRAPATLHIIPALEHIRGAFFPHGGMHSITRALFDLAIDLGVRFHFGSEVEQIVIEDKRAKGLLIGQKLHTADVVVSNVDIYFSYRKLLKQLKAPERLLKQQKSSSALVFYWGIKREFPELGLHNILFSGNYRDEFETIHRGNEMSQDPTIYINITSKLNSADAPAGMENWFVLINAPNHRGQDWSAMAAQLRKNVLLKLNNMLGVQVEPLIAHESVWLPPGIEQLTGSFAGALYGNSSNNRFAAFLRHPNFSSHAKGLYFCGGSVHPGGGIPLCLKGAELVSKCIQEDFSA